MHTDIKINPVTLSTRYQYLEQYAMGGKVIAKKELPWKLIILGATALVITFCILNDSKRSVPETPASTAVNHGLE